MVVGDLGLPGLHVPRPVVEEIRTDTGSVTVQSRHMVAQTVRVRALKRNGVTPTRVSLYDFPYFDFQIFFIKVLWMVGGVTGLTGQTVPRPVVEELKPESDSATVQPQLMVVQSVRGMALKRESATITYVS